MRTAVSLSLVTLLLLGASTATLAQTFDHEARVCAAAKLKAVGKKTASKLKCRSVALLKEATPDPACLARAEQKFADAMAAAEARGGCFATGDTAAVEADVEDFVDAQVHRQTTAPPPSCPEFGTTCGGCGDGYCAHRPAASDICVSAGSAVPQTCSSDSDCGSGDFCVSDGMNLACAAACE